MSQPHVPLRKYGWFTTMRQHKARWQPAVKQMKTLTQKLVLNTYLVLSPGFPHCKQSANQMKSLCTGERGDRLASVDILVLVCSLVPRSSEGVYSWCNLVVVQSLPCTLRGCHKIRACFPFQWVYSAVSAGWVWLVTTCDQVTYVITPIAEAGSPPPFLTV